MATKRVFILGAGFSRQADMPSANDLTRLLVEKFEGHPDAPRYFQYLQARIKWLEGTTYESINFEQLFDFVPFDIELYKMMQQLIPPDHRVGRQLNIQSWLKNMEDDLRNIIWEKEEKSREHLESIEQFSIHLDPNGNDVVLTFNYDTLLEKSLDLQKIKWHYGFEKEKGCGVKILKMHGSINWIKVPRDQKNNYDGDYTLLSEPPSEDYVLYQVPDKKVPDKIKYRHLHGEYEIEIAGLGTYKPLSDLVGGGEIWNNNAYRALRDCEHIYVIGFSFSRFDTMARLFFGGVMMERFENKIKLPKITLIDPKANNLNKRIESIFGHDVTIVLVPKEAEKVDWDEWLN